MSDRLLITDNRNHPHIEIYDAVVFTGDPENKIVAAVNSWLDGLPPWKVRFDSLNRYEQIVDIIEGKLQAKWGMEIQDVWAFYAKEKSLQHPLKEELLEWLEER